MTGKDEANPEARQRDSVSPEEADRLASQFTPLWETEPAAALEGAELTPPHSPAANRARGEASPEAPLAQATAEPVAAANSTQSAPQPAAGSAQTGGEQPSASSKRRRHNTLMGLQAPTGDPVASSRPPPAPDTQAAAPRIPPAARTVLGIAPPPGPSEGPPVAASPATAPPATASPTPGSKTVVGLGAPPAAEAPPPPPVPAEGALPAAAETAGGAESAPPAPLEETEDLLPEHKAEYAPPAALPAAVRSADLQAPAVAVRQDPVDATEQTEDEDLERHERSLRRTDPPKRAPDALPPSMRPHRSRALVVGVLVGASVLALIGGAITLSRSADEPSPAPEERASSQKTASPPKLGNRDDTAKPLAAAAKTEEAEPAPSPSTATDPAPPAPTATEKPARATPEKHPSLPRRGVQSAPTRATSPSSPDPTTVEKSRPKARKPHSKPPRNKPRGGAIVREAPF